MQRLPRLMPLPGSWAPIGGARVCRRLPWKIPEKNFSLWGVFCCFFSIWGSFCYVFPLMGGLFRHVRSLFTMSGLFTTFFSLWGPGLFCLYGEGDLFWTCPPPPQKKAHSPLRKFLHLADDLLIYVYGGHLEF